MKKYSITDVMASLMTGRGKVLVPNAMH